MNTQYLSLRRKEKTRFDSTQRKWGNSGGWGSPTDLAETRINKNMVNNKPEIIEALAQEQKLPIRKHPKYRLYYIYFICRICTLYSTPKWNKKVVLDQNCLQQHLWKDVQGKKYHQSPVYGLGLMLIDETQEHVDSPPNWTPQELRRTRFPQTNIFTAAMKSIIQKRKSSELKEYCQATLKSRIFLLRNLFLFQFFGLCYRRPISCSCAQEFQFCIIKWFFPGARKSIYFLFKVPEKI